MKRLQIYQMGLSASSAGLGNFYRLINDGANVIKGGIYIIMAAIFAKKKRTMNIFNRAPV